MLPTRAPVYSSLILQMILYYNCIYSPIYFLSIIVVGINTFDLEADDTTALVFSIVRLVFFVIMTPVEGARLWLGYRGNLKEKVSDLSVCFLLTIVPQLLGAVLQVAYEPTPLQVAVSIPYLVFIVLEMIFCYRATRRFIRKQTALFYRYCQEVPEGPRDRDDGSEASSLLDRGARTLNPTVGGSGIEMTDATRQSDASKSKTE